MKFAKYLKENRIEEWKEYYVKYKALKKHISGFSQQQITDKDQLFFISKIEEQADVVEDWFLKVRNDCVKELNNIKKNLPKKKIQSLHFAMKNNRINTSDESSNKNKNDDDDGSSSGFEEDFEEFNNENENNNDNNNNNLIHTSKVIHKKNETNSVELQNINQPDTIIDMENENNDNNNDNKTSRLQFIDDTTDNESALAKPTIDENEDDNENDGDDEEEDEDDDNTEELKQNEDIDYDGDDNRRKRKRIKLNEKLEYDLAKWSLNDGIYSHLPSSEHKKCVQIILTLSRLKLFGWQNMEGIRKIIKKFDKMCNCNLTQSYWPKLSQREFTNPKTHHMYFSECANILMSYTIPFENFSPRYMLQNGVDLFQLSTAIQQLDTVTQEEFPEVIPMSVEPRSYMANERTYLKWMRMGALTAIVGMALISFHHEPVTGILLILFSVAILIRSFHEYRRRTEVLVDRIDHTWDDRLGPKLLLFALLLPMITYIVYLAVYQNDNNAKL